MRICQTIYETDSRSKTPDIYGKKRFSIFIVYMICKDIKNLLCIIVQECRTGKRYMAMTILTLW